MVKSEPIAAMFKKCGGKSSLGSAFYQNETWDAPGPGRDKPSKFFDFSLFSPCSAAVNRFNTRKSQD
jgi:hypothetical protein